MDERDEKEYQVSDPEPSAAGWDAIDAAIPDVRLRPLAMSDEPAALRAHAVMADEGFPFLIGWRAGTPWAHYVERLERERQGIDLVGERVPVTFLVADVEGELVGRLSVRHRLNDRLAIVGGHIGYAVLPGWRRRGLASHMMRAGMDLLASIGVEAALVTCDEGNLGSAAVIEHAGGRLEGVHDRVRRYWVPTDAAQAEGGQGESAAPS